MRKQIHTGIYHIPIHGIDHDVAHLYEHLIIVTFKQSLKDLGFSKYLFGWVGGETFRDVLFIEYGIYNAEVEKAFKQFMSKPQRINYEYLDNELLRIQAEEKMLINSIDKDTLVEQLRRLDSEKFLDHDEDIDTIFTTHSTEPVPSKTISMRKSKSKYKDITIMLGARNLTAKEKLAFLRLTPMLHDTINDCLYALGSYQNESSWAIDKPARNGMFIATIYTIRRNSYTNKQIVKSLHDSLEALRSDVQNHPNELRHYIDGFLSTPNWNDFPIDYFRYAGIITSKKNVAESLTPATIDALISKIEVEVTVTNQDHWNLM